MAFPKPIRILAIFLLLSFSGIALTPTDFLQDSTGASIGEQTIIPDGTGKYNIDLALDEKGSFVSIKGAKEVPLSLDAKFDEYTEKSSGDIKFSTPVFAIESLEIKTAAIRLPKNGIVEKIFECPQFNVQEFSCPEWYATNLTFINSGEYVEFNTTHFSGYGGGEINATNSIHLDSSQNFISNIFSQINNSDNVWSEPIYANEYVRVTYQENLTNGSIIDIKARSNGTITYFEIYQAGTSHKVGRSQTYDSAEHTYIPVTNLTAPTDTFDFKIIKVVAPQNGIDSCISQCKNECDENPYAGCYSSCDVQCETVTNDSSRTAFMEFDYIHDAPITTNLVEGLIAYGELNVATPRVRTWNGTNFSSEQNALSVGTDGTEDIDWVVVKGNHERDEFILGTQDGSLDVNIQIYNSTDWENLLEITPDAPSMSFRSFDIGIEDVSGEVLIVYENSSTADTTIAYRIWNGTAYSTEQNLTFASTAMIAYDLELFELAGTDQMMLLFYNNTGGANPSLSKAYYIPWNGTHWLMNQSNIIGAVSSSGGRKAYFAWETSSRDGLALYNNNLLVRLRRYDHTCSGGVCWDAADHATISQGGGSSDSVGACSDRYSDHIGIVFTDGTIDVGVRVWNGTDVLSSAPDDNEFSEGQARQNYDCAFFNSTTALFGVVNDSSGRAIDYVNFTKTNSWGVSNLSNAASSFVIGSASGSSIEGLFFTLNPLTSEIMTLVADATEDIRTVLWNGTEFTNITANPLETSTEVNDSTQDPASFDYTRYDPVPNITISVPANNTNFTALSTVNITINSTDNVAIDIVNVSVALPNGTIRQYNATRVSSTTFYELNFTDTSLAGRYNFSATVNDTSTHQNSNTTSGFFNIIQDTVHITVNNPANNTLSASFLNAYFNASQDSGQNITVALYIDWAHTHNITIQNGTTANLSYIFSSEGNHTWYVKANDTIDTENSESRTFIYDVTAPTLVQDFTANVQSGNAINFNFNITDLFGLGNTTLTVVKPQGTSQDLPLSFSLHAANTTTGYNLSGNYSASFLSSQNGWHEYSLAMIDYAGNERFYQSKVMVSSTGGAGAGQQITPKKLNGSSNFFTTVLSDFEKTCFVWTTTAPTCTLTFTIREEITQLNIIGAFAQVQNAAKNKASITYTGLSDVFAQKQTLPFNLNGEEKTVTFGILNFYAIILQIIIGIVVLIGGVAWLKNK